MVGLEEFSRVVGDVHASTGVPDRWQHTMEVLACTLDAAACTLTIGEGPDRSVYTSNMDATALEEYVAHYRPLDYVLAACESAPVGLVCGGWDLVARNVNTEFYNDWQRRFKLTDGLTVRLSSTTPSSLVVSASPAADPYETTERIRFVKALVPHLRRALAGREQLRDGTQSIDISGAPDVIRHAVFIVGGAGKVVRMNAAARSVAQTADGLYIANDRLEASSPIDDADLQAAITRALPGRPGTTRHGSVVVSHRPSGNRPFVVRVVPLDTDRDPRRGRAAVIAVNPAQEIVASKSLLQRLFNFTNTEYEIAARMLRGDELKIIADDLTVSMSTVKTHVQHIFAKTGTHRQAELVRLLYAVAS